MPTECRSLRDTGLKYKYNPNGTIARFTHVYSKSDTKDRLERLKSFADKVNKLSKKHDLGYTLVFTDEGRVPTLKIKNIPGRPVVAIAQFVRDLCYNHDETINVPVKPSLDDTPTASSSSSKPSTVTCTDKKTSRSCWGSPNCTWSIKSKKCRARGGVRSKNLRFEGPERK